MSRIDANWTVTASFMCGPVFHGPETVAKLIYNSSLPEFPDMLIDYEGDGTFEEIITPDHDVAIIDLTASKTLVGQGYSVLIKVTVENQGIYTETFNVTLCVDKNITVLGDEITIGNQTVSSLTNGASTTLTFTWSTIGTAKGNYTIWAFAWPVPEEADTTDNTLTNGWITVAMVGDITGPDGWPDGKCDIRDVAMVARLFGVNYPDPRYDPDCDLTGPTSGVPDGKIDIRDIALVAKHFGEIDP